MPFGSLIIPDDYTARLKEAQLRQQYQIPNAKPATAMPTPNQQFDIQNAARQGTLIAPQQDVLYQGINEREDQINKASDIQTQKAFDQAAYRKKQYAQSIQDQFGNPLDFSAGEPTSGTYGSNGQYGDDELGNASRIYDIGKKLGIDDQGIKTAIMTALTESGLKNLHYGDRDSQGLFQQRPSQGWGTVEQVTNPDYAINKFFSVYKNSAGATPWLRAQAVQRSFDPTGNNYLKNWQRANNIFSQLGSRINPASSGGANPAGVNDWINANNNRYLDYDRAFGAQCVDLYAYYTSGFAGGNPNPVGWAGEIFNNYDSRAYNRYGANVPGRLGDVAVWGTGPYTPSTHVAIVVGDNGNGTLRVLQANARGYSNPSDPRNTTIISNISKAALLGYLRPRKLGG